MTTGGSLGERPVTAPQLLNLCDRALGEVSRRRHLFGWLRAPGAEEWLVVDAYYPGNRLIVLCRDSPSPGDELIAARAPEHGLRLLALTPSALAGDPVAVAVALRRRLDELGPPPPRPRAVPADPRPSPVAQAVASLAQRQPPRSSPAVTARPTRPPRAPQPAAVERGARFVAAHRAETERMAHAAALSRVAEPIRRPRRPPRRASGPAPPRPPRTARTSRTARVGAVNAVVLAAVLIAEVYFGMVRWALDGGHLLLAFAIALDVCARTLGTIAAGRAGKKSAAWSCALGGSPFVAGFALYGPDGPVKVDPAPLAGLLALSAGGALAIAFVVAALGGG